MAAPDDGHAADGVAQLAVAAPGRGPEEARGCARCLGFAQLTDGPPLTGDGAVAADSHIYSSLSAHSGEWSLGLCVGAHSLEIHDHNRLFPYDPGVMPRTDQGDIAWMTVEFRPVIHADSDHARHVVLEMGGLATVRLGDGLYRLRPAPACFERGPADNDPADCHQFQAAVREFANFIRMLEVLQLALFQNLCNVLRSHSSTSKTPPLRGAKNSRKP